MVAPTDPFFFLFSCESHGMRELHVAVGKQFNRVEAFFFLLVSAGCARWQVGGYLEGMGVYLSVLRTGLLLVQPKQKKRLAAAVVVIAAAL